MRARRDKLMDAKVPVVMEDVQVAAKARRRTYTAEYKRRIVKEADACTTPGAVGALLRREGLYSSHLVVWRRARGRGELGELARRRWPRASGGRPGRALTTAERDGVLAPLLEERFVDLRPAQVWAQRC